MSKAVYTRYQIYIKPSRLAKFFAIGDTAADELRKVFGRYKASDVNTSPHTGIISLSLPGGDEANINRIMRIEDEILDLIDTVPLPREEELLAIAKWAISIALDHPGFGSYQIDHDFHLAANDVIEGDTGASFIRVMRKAQRA